MSNWLIALFFAIGVTGWVYTKLVRSNGNASPKQDIGGAALAGVIAFVFLFTLLKFVLNF